MTTVPRTIGSLSQVLRLRTLTIAEVRSYVHVFPWRELGRASKELSHRLIFPFNISFPNGFFSRICTVLLTVLSKRITVFESKPLGL